MTPSLTYRLQTWLEFTTGKSRRDKCSRRLLQNNRKSIQYISIVVIIIVDILMYLILLFFINFFGHVIMFSFPNITILHSRKCKRKNQVTVCKVLVSQQRLSVSHAISYFVIFSLTETFYITFQLVANGLCVTSEEGENQCMTLEKQAKDIPDS